MSDDKPKKPDEIPALEKDAETDPMPKREPLIQPEKEPQIQPKREPLTTPPPGPPERLSQK